MPDIDPPMDLLLQAPDEGDRVPDLSEVEPSLQFRCGPPVGRERGRFSAALAISLFIHVATLLALAWAAEGPGVRDAGRTIPVTLVKHAPSAAPRPAGLKTARADSSSGRTPQLRKPPPEPPPRLRKPPPEPPPKSARRSKRPKGPTQAAASPNVSPNAISQTVLPFFSLPGAFASRELAGQGTRGSAYKGLVFARIQRAEENAAEQARGRTGQAIVAFSVKDDGAIAALTIEQSSGAPALDGLALAIVRRASPFPPPPADARRNFAVAIAFGQQ